MPAVIDIPKDIYDKCKRFASTNMSYNPLEYQRRGQSNHDKITFDVFTGKLAEWGVYLQARNLGVQLAEPDMRIVQPDQKTFDPDLQVGKWRIHVKSVDYDNAKKYGMSWSFSIKDHLITRPHKHDLIYLCVVRHNGDSAKVKILGKAQAVLVTGLYGLPRKETLQHSKRVLYWDIVKPNFSQH